jgi:hypothetical protein
LERYPARRLRACAGSAGVWIRVQAGWLRTAHSIAGANATVMQAASTMHGRAGRRHRAIAAANPAGLDAWQGLARGRDVGPTGWRNSLGRIARRQQGSCGRLHLLACSQSERCSSAADHWARAHAR